jgi:hypothetical protein
MHVLEPSTWDRYRLYLCFKVLDHLATCTAHTLFAPMRGVRRAAPPHAACCYQAASNSRAWVSQAMFSQKDLLPHYCWYQWPQDICGDITQNFMVLNSDTLYLQALTTCQLLRLRTQLLLACQLCKVDFRLCWKCNGGRQPLQCFSYHVLFPRHVPHI